VKILRDYQYNTPLASEFNEKFIGLGCQLYARYVLTKLHFRVSPEDLN
jgi:hypothetical protein